MINMKKIKKAAVIGGLLGAASGIVLNCMSSNMSTRKKMMKAGRNIMKKSYGYLKHNRILRNAGVRI